MGAAEGWPFATGWGCRRQGGRRRGWAEGGGLAERALLAFREAWLHGGCPIVASQAGVRVCENPPSSLPLPCSPRCGIDVWLHKREIKEDAETRCGINARLHRRERKEHADTRCGGCAHLLVFSSDGFRGRSSTPGE